MRWSAESVCMLIQRTCVPILDDISRRARQQRRWTLAYPRLVEGMRCPLNKGSPRHSKAWTDSDLKTLGVLEKDQPGRLLHCFTLMRCHGTAEHMNIRKCRLS